VAPPPDAEQPFLTLALISATSCGFSCGCFRAGGHCATLKEYAPFPSDGCYFYFRNLNKDKPIFAFHDSSDVARKGAMLGLPNKAQDDA
jgi:hypothetical protein